MPHAEGSGAAVPWTALLPLATVPMRTDRAGYLIATSLPPRAAES